MAITPSDIQALRQQTGVGMMEAKKALEASHGDIAKAIEQLRKSGLKMAEQKSSRAVKEGVVGTYLHANGKVGAMVALACETDFVARTDDFKDLAHDIALHIAAANPHYLDSASVPADILHQEREVYRGQLEAEGKPEKMWDKIIEGKFNKFYTDNCLLKQVYVKDDTQTVEQLIQAAVGRLGENIQIVSFSRETI